MRLTARLIKLETAYMANRDYSDPYKTALENDIREWIVNDPRAADLLAKEYKYCVSKGYPTQDIGFVEQLDDPVLDKMNLETLEAFDKYLRTRSAF